MGDLRLLTVTGSAQPLNLIQKCDAKRPCSTCVLAKCISECVYDDEKRLQPASTRPLQSADGHLSGRQLEDADLIEISTPASIDGVLADMIIARKVNANVLRF